MKEDGHKNLNPRVKNHFFSDLLTSHSLFPNTVMLKRLSVRSKDVAPSECRALEPGVGAYVYSSHFLGAVRTGVTTGVETSATGVESGATTGVETGVTTGVESGATTSKQNFEARPG